jgi:hypothetical protein
MRREGEACLALTHEEGTFVGATHASPSISGRACGGRGMPRPYARRRNLRRGDACVALDQQPRMRREGEACLAPTHEEGTFVGATHASPSIGNRACGERARQCLAPTHEEATFVGATHCVTLDQQPRMWREGEAMPRPYEFRDHRRRQETAALQQNASILDRANPVDLYEDRCAGQVPWISFWWRATRAKAIPSSKCTARPTARFRHAPYEHAPRYKELVQHVDHVVHTVAGLRGLVRVSSKNSKANRIETMKGPAESGEK